MKVRRLISFIVLLPIWPFVIVASMADDESKVEDVVSCFKDTWMRIYEKR